LRTESAKDFLDFDITFPIVTVKVKKKCAIATESVAF